MLSSFFILFHSHSLDPLFNYLFYHCLTNTDITNVQFIIHYHHSMYHDKQDKQILIIFIFCFWVMWEMFLFYQYEIEFIFRLIFILSSSSFMRSDIKSCCLHSSSSFTLTLSIHCLIIFFIITHLHTNKHQHNPSQSSTSWTWFEICVLVEMTIDWGWYWRCDDNDRKRRVDLTKTHTVKVVVKRYMISFPLTHFILLLWLLIDHHTPHTTLTSS